MSKGLKSALKAGLASYFAISIIAAILLSPYWLTIEDNCHSHSENAQNHLHSLNFFIQGDFVTATIEIETPLKTFEKVQVSVFIPIDFSFQQRLRCRAPPTL